MVRKGTWVQIPLLSPMKLLQLHEVGSASAKTVERIMNYVEEDSSIVKNVSVQEEIVLFVEKIVHGKMD